jgi:hemoglobin
LLGSLASQIDEEIRSEKPLKGERRWVALLLEAADEVGLQDDAEFRASFVGYLEWGSRLAVINSQDGAEAPRAD